MYQRTAWIVIFALLILPFAVLLPPLQAADCETKLTASDAAADDQFGQAVAIDGDIIVVGAPYDDEGGANQGSAYVFKRTAGVWSQAAKLTASDGAAEDLFGASAAVSGSTIVVGALRHKTAGLANAGAAYVFREIAGVWTQVAKLTAASPRENAGFGFSVATTGDVIAVGAPGTSLTPTPLIPVGATYVFVEPGGGWTTATETARLTAGTGTLGEFFGDAVRMEGDTMVVGAPGIVLPGFTSTGQKGAAYVYIKPVSGWSTTSTFNAKLTASDGAIDDFFGDAVAISGDTIIVGAEGDDDGAANAGSAYVYVRPVSGWATTSTFKAKLEVSDPVADHELADTIGFDGTMLVLGAEGDDDNGARSGAAYLFEKPAGGWANGTEYHKFTASDGAANDKFGQSVAMSGSTIVIGSPEDDDHGDKSGSVYVYIPCVPDMPALNTPADTATVTTTQPTLTWSAPLYAVRYELKIGKTNPPTTPAINVTTNSYQPSPLLPGVQYYWQVRAFNALDEASGWSPVFSFTIASPNGSAPLRNYFTTGTPLLTWNRVTWATGYEVQVNSAPSFGGAINHLYPINNPAALYVTTTPLPDGVYYWRVRAKKSDGTYGAWSAADSFVVAVQ